MNPLPRRSSWLTLITSLLAFLLAVTWTVSLFSFIKLHQLEGAIPIGIAEFGSATEGKSSGSNIMSEIRDGPENAASAVGSSEDVHIVFSTDCSGYQHWQSIANYYSFRRSGHEGPITRIVSGCSPEQEKTIRNELDRIRRRHALDRGGLRAHFTPSFSLGGKHYKYSNKPGGLYHFMMNHTSSSPMDESVMALVDPDMMALRPIIPQLGEGMASAPVTRDGYNKLVEYRDESGRVMLLRQKGLPPLPPRVTRGVAAGQHFGLGGKWVTAGTKNAGKDFREFNLTSVCGQGSPCLNVPPDDSSRGSPYTTRELADKSYAVGPVYIASRSDWTEILPRWYEFTPRVHEQYPKLLAEMFAFTMSAADIQLRFALSSSYMVSDPSTMSTTESWMWVDEYEKIEQSSSENGKKEGPVGNMRGVCEGATPHSLPTETMKRLVSYGYGNYRRGDIFPSTNNRAGGLPTLLHYCQNYKFANHTFAKRKMPHDFFRCDGLPLKLDVEAMLNELDSVENDTRLSRVQKKKQMRTGFMLCHLIPLMNMALEDYIREVC